MSRLADLAARWRAQRLRSSALDGAACLACACFAGASLLAALDQAFAPPQAARWALLAAASASAAAAAWRLLLLPWLRLDWRGVLREAERRFPPVAESLSAAWDLRESAGPHTSSELRLAHLAQTERLLSTLPDEPVFVFSPSRAARRAAAAAAVAVAALPWLWRSPSWERALAPWRDVPLERYVQIVPGTRDVSWGKPVVIEARWDARGPVEGSARPILWVRGADGWSAARWDRESSGLASFTAEEVAAPFVYRLSWRDLRSAAYRLTPVAAPQLESLRAVIHGADEGVSALDASQPLSVLRGSWISVVGKPNQPLGHAALRLSSLPGEIALKPAASGELSATFPLREDASLRLDLETADGRRDPDPPVYSMRAVADEAPKIELLSPLQPVQVSPDDALPLSYAARDDGGVVVVSLLVKSGDGPEKELPVVRFADPRKEQLGDYSWDLSGLPLGKVRFRFKALDNAVPPQAGFSQPGELEIADFASAHRSMEERWVKAEKSLERVSERERALRERLAASAAPPEEAQLKTLPDDWKQAVDDMSALARSMQDDAYANPGMAEAAKREAEELEAAQRDELPQAMADARGRSLGDARREHARLAQKTDAARRLLAEGRKVQGMQDLFSDAGRMSQTSASLENALETAASRKAISQADRKNLDEALGKLDQQMRSLQQTLERLPKADSAPEAASRQSVELPIDSALREADALAQALARGDYAAAADIARKLSDDLSRVERALGSAAQGSSAASSARETSKELQKIQQSWSEALDSQTKAVEGARGLDRDRVRRKLAAEKELLAQLAREQAVQVSSAEALGASFRPEVLPWMRSVQGEFEAGKVTRAPDLLRAVSARLRVPAMDGSRSLLEEKFAVAEESILRRLEEGAADGPAAATREDGEAAARAQAEARGKASALQKSLEGFSEQGGMIPSGVLGKIEQAQVEQGRAEGDLGRGDAASGLKHGQAALELLSQGAQQLGDAAGSEGSVESGLGQPFQKPGTVIRVLRSGGGTGEGAQLGFVPLPSSKDYAPPRELRQELEKSMREPRPASYEKIIKEYFKRVAQ